MTWSRVAARLTASLALLGLCAGTAFADPQQPKGEGKGRGKAIQMRMMVTRLSNDGRGVDPKAKELESKLSNQGIRFDSAEVLQKKQLEMGAGEVSTIEARAETLASVTDSDPTRFLDWCVAFAGMVASELAASAGPSDPRVQTALLLAEST